MLLKCDVVKCIYNKGCICVAGVASITLTYDKLSKEIYLECETMVESEDEE